MSDRNKLMSQYEDLRVADVRDGMDTVLRHHYGSVSPSIRPLWRTRAFGIARTCRYLPGRDIPPNLGPDEYWKWVGEYYGSICTYPWMDAIEDGDFIIIDQSGLDVGLMGSANTLTCIRKGAGGFVSNGGVRDTDEVVMQKIPFWSLMCSQSMVQARLEFDAMDVPVAIGGVQVRPGDMVVADGDGVIVVPQEIALDVAQHAHDEHERDKVSRGNEYEALGWDKDESVR
jgi:4-hydroxy-4-methyl-2-oxoglutarate aldolase